MTALAVHIYFQIAGVWEFCLRETALLIHLEKGEHLTKVCIKYYINITICFFPEKINMDTICLKCTKYTVLNVDISIFNSRKTHEYRWIYQDCL